VVHAGQDLFAWLHRHRLAITGPTMEEHLVDADGTHRLRVSPGSSRTAHPRKVRVSRGGRVGQASVEVRPTGQETPVPPMPQ
jgi:hypothetical protein